LEHAVHGGFRDRESGAVGEVTGQLTRAQTGQLQRGFDDGGLLGRPQAIPHRTGFRLAIRQPGFALLAIALLPAIKRRARQPQLGDGGSLRLWRPPHLLDQLAFLLGTHALVPPPRNQS
jgi:hypothetical protein